MWVMLLSPELCYGLRPHPYKISQRQHWVSKPCLCALSQLLAEQHPRIFLLFLSSFCCQLTLTSFSQLQLRLDCCQLKQCFSLHTKYFSYLYLLSAPSFFFFKLSQKFFVNLCKSSAMPTFCPVEWIGFELWRGSSWRSAGSCGSFWLSESCFMSELN